MAVLAIISDLDDTLVLTREAHVKAWEMAIVEMGIRFNGDLNTFWGLTSDKIAEKIAPGRGPELHERKRSWYREMVRQYARPAPCAVDLINETRSSGVKFGIVTSSSMAMAEITLSVLGYTPKVVVAGDMVRNPKPHPEPTLLALERLGVSPGDTLSVGDMDFDALSFLSAGIRRVFLIGKRVEGAETVRDLCHALDRIREEL